jgi:1-pyrroline-5-carboxylate dehydrogenase
MQSAKVHRAGVKALRCTGTFAQRKGVASLATFKTPKVFNEPNQHYTKGSQQREGLSQAVEKLRGKLPLKVPVVVGGQEACPPRYPPSFFRASPPLFMR